MVAHALVCPARRVSTLEFAKNQAPSPSGSDPLAVSRLGTLVHDSLQLTAPAIERPLLSLHPNSDQLNLCYKTCSAITSSREPLGSRGSAETRWVSPFLVEAPTGSEVSLRVVDMQFKPHGQVIGHLKGSPLKVVFLFIGRLLELFRVRRPHGFDI